MATRRPTVSIGGRPARLPTSDVLSLDSLVAADQIAAGATGVIAHNVSGDLLGRGGVKLGSDGVNGLPTRLDSSSNNASFLYRHAATSGTFREAWLAYASVKDGWFTGVGFASFWGGSQTELSMGRLWLGKLGKYTHHSAATKTGAGWQGRTWDYAYGGDLTLSTVAGDQISFSSTGTHLVLRTVTISNGGYAIVSIDGSWTAANRCALFTAADLAAGLCRAGDVGKRYVNSYSLATCGWFDIPLADDLTDTAHAVVFEATGTKPLASSDVRAHVGGVVGCSAVDAVGIPGVAGATIAHVQGAYDATSGSSAFAPVPELLNAAGNAYEFLGEPHIGATQTGFSVTCDGVESSAMAVGTYRTAGAIRFRMTSTMASTDAPLVPVINKVNDFIVAANGPCPVSLSSSMRFLSDRKVRWAYALMLPLTQVSPGTNIQQNDAFWKWSIQGGLYSNTTPLALNNGADYGKVRAKLVEAKSSGARVAYAALFDTAGSVRNFLLSTGAAVFVTDNLINEKAYFTRSETKSPESWVAGDVWTVLGGWGVLPAA